MTMHDLLQVALSMFGTIGTAMVVLMWQINEKLAVIIARVDSHEKRIDKLENV